MMTQRGIVAFIIMMSVFMGALVGVGSAHAGGCPNVAWFAVGGNGDPGSARVPGVPGGVWLSRIQYPADVFRGDWSRDIARDSLNRQAHDLRAVCPGSRLEIRSYSLGASAASLATDWWITDGRMNYNINAVFYGNPRQPGGAFGGIETTGAPLLPGYTPRGPMRLAWWTRNVCHPGQDIICSAPRPIHSNLGWAWTATLGYLGQGHWY